MKRIESKICLGHNMVIAHLLKFFSSLFYIILVHNFGECSQGNVMIALRNLYYVVLINQPRKDNNNLALDRQDIGRVF
jgi:hypothetical protein